MKNQFRIKSMLFMVVFISIIIFTVTLQFSKQDEATIVVKNKYYEWEMKDNIII